MNPNVPPPTSLLALGQLLWKYRDLIGKLTKRNVLSRYRGSALGLFWSLLHPLIMLSVFTFVFSVVMKSRWGIDSLDEEESRAMFAIILFVGLILHAFLSEVISNSPNSISQNANYVKKVVFPLEILPVTVLLAAMFHAAMSFLIWLVVYFLLVGVFQWEMLLIPIVVAPYILLLAGAAYVLSAIGAYVRDISQIMGVLSTVLLFLSPIFFPLERLPENIRYIAMLNPLTLIIEQARGVLIWHEAPDYFSLGIYGLVSIGLLQFGFWWFQICRRGFADVL